MKLGCIVMAAGSAVRFGGNKLSEILEGESVFRRTLSAIPAERFDSVVVVTQYPSFSTDIKDFHFTSILNNKPEDGISRTIALGLHALPQDCEGVLFCVSDQPLLRRQSIERLVEAWQKSPSSIAALSHEGQRGNPCLFPAWCFPELLALTGDQGGSAVIRRHKESLILVEATAEELWDIDTPEALEKVRTQIKRGEAAPSPQPEGLSPR